MAWSTRSMRRLRRPDRPAGTTLLRTSTAIGRFVLGDGIAADALHAELETVRAPRAILVSEPGAWGAVGERLANGLRERGREVVHVLLPRARRPSGSRSSRARPVSWPRLRVERSRAAGRDRGGALGDTAGFLAAVYLRGVPIIHVPTTLVAQIDSSIGGKTGVDLPEGKNLVGAFHQPAAVIIDIAMLRTLPERQMRAALGEAVKMAALGDERLFELLETDGPAIARGDEVVFTSGVLAELVERAGWAKVEVVLADERERGASGGRIALNLGHSLGHAFEAAGGYGGLLHGEAVAYGLRAASPDRGRGGSHAAGTRRADRPAARRPRARDPAAPLPARRRCMDHLATDKKHAAGRLRWVLPTADGVVIRDDIDPALVERGRRRPSGDPERQPAMTTVLVLRGPEPQPRRHPRAGDLRLRIARPDPRRDRGAGGGARPRRSPSSSRTTRAR